MASSTRSSPSCARCVTRSAGPAAGLAHAIEDQLKTIVDAALEGKRVDMHDNLFEIGASSLKLIEIHESIDREYPGLRRSHGAVRLPDDRRAGPAPRGQARHARVTLQPPDAARDLLHSALIAQHSSPK